MKKAELVQQTKNIEIFQNALNEIINHKDRSAWNKGVTKYAIDLIDYAINNIEYFTGDIAKRADVEEFLLNGARNWAQYSWAGCALVYDSDIAKMLCTPSELKKTRNGERRPNSQEEWLDTQARALYQAANRAEKAIRHAAIKRGTEQ